MSAKNTFKPEWYLEPALGTWITEYYSELRCIAREYASFLWLARCRDCEILFLTPQRNSGRTDMRCPTGCRARHEAVSSAERSRGYRKSDRGREKKKALNRNRSLISESAKRQNPDTSDLPKDQWLSDQLRYYRWLIWLLEGIRMEAAELKLFCEAIRTKVRQRGREIGDKPRHIADD